MIYQKAPLPIGPLHIWWTLPENFDEMTAGKFHQAGRALLERNHRVPYVTNIQRDGPEALCYLNLDFGGATFPGYFNGDKQRNGKPALNDYVVELAFIDREIMRDFLNLLSKFGAEVEWEQLEPLMIA